MNFCFTAAPSPGRGAFKPGKAGAGIKNLGNTVADVGPLSACLGGAGNGYGKE